MIGMANSLVPNELSELNSDFINYFDKPAGLWLPCDKHGARTPDFSGNLNYGTLNGGVTTSGDGVGVLEKSWKYDGSLSSYLTSSVLISISAFSLHAVVNPSSISAFLAIISGNAVASPLFRINAGGALSLVSIGNSTIGTSSGTVAAGVWSLVSVVYDGTNYAFFINGNPAGSGLAAGSFLRSGTATFFGVQPVNNVQPFAGAIAFVDIHNIAASAAQISALYSLLLYGEPFKLFQPSIFERLYSSSQPNIPLNLTSKSFVFSSSYAKQNINRSLRSEMVSQSEALGNISVQTLTQFQLLSFRRYSSQYFVQGGYSEDNGQ